MNSFDFNFNSNNNQNSSQSKGDGLKPGMPDMTGNSFGPELMNTKQPKPQYYGNIQTARTIQRNARAQQNPVISGYFVKEKSYKEIIISRINTVLCGILGCLVLVCLVSYYFVVLNEMELRKLSKETIALNYDNVDMQNKLDNLQSFSNVDFAVTKSNTLTRAKKVIELSAANVPHVNYDKKKNEGLTNRYLGY